MAKKKKKVVKKSAKKVVKKTAKKQSSKKAVKRVAKRPSKKAAKKPAPQPVKQKTISIAPYLTFPGNCEEAFNFYRSVFGGEFGYVGRFKDMPPMEGQPSAPESELNKIMHISLPIGIDHALMGSDSSDAFGHATIVGNNFSISINATSNEEADRLYNGLSAGGQTTMPMNKTFWGSYFGMCTDRFGIQWMVSYEVPQNKK
jgi:PhnB protein